MKITTDFGELNIDEPGSNEGNWITIESQSITFDKNDFFIRKFNNDFPTYTLLGSNNLERYTFLSELCARTPTMRKWYASVQISYSDSTQLPLYLKDVVAPDEYKAVQEKLLILRDELAVITKKRNDLAAKYSADLNQLRVDEKVVVKKTIGADNIMKIVTLTTESLPLSIQMKIQSYMANSSDADVADNRRRLAQEYLAKFKTALIKLDKVSKIADIDGLIDEISLK